MENNPVTPAEQLKLQNNDPVEDSKIAFIQPTVNGLISRLVLPKRWARK